MTQVTVKELAQVVDTPVERLLQQMREAGLSHSSADQVVTDNEKQALLAYLKGSHGEKVEEPRKITLQRKTTTTLRVAGSKTVSVEVRKKKTYVKRSPEELEADRLRELAEQQAAEEAARQKAVEEAKKQAAEAASRQAQAPAGAAPAAAPVTPDVEAVAAAPLDDRKKEEVRRVPDRPAPTRDEDERRDSNPFPRAALAVRLDGWRSGDRNTCRWESLGRIACSCRTKRGASESSGSDACRDPADRRWDCRRDWHPSDRTFDVRTEVGGCLVPVIGTLSQ